MGKLDAILQSVGGNIDESMGANRQRTMHGATPPPPPAPPARLQGVARSKDAAEIPVAKIDRDPAQPREDFDPEGLERLAESLRTRGQLQPIRVRWDEGRGAYVIVCGERRWRAAKMAGLETLCCVIVDRPLDPGELLALQLIENALREDLRPIEQAKAYRALMDLNGWSGNQLARELAVNQATVARALALLELPRTVQERVEQGTLSPSVAYEVSKLADPVAQQEVAAQVVAEDLSRAEAVEVVRQRSGKGRGGKAGQVKRRVIRTAAGRVTVELRKGSGPEAIRAALAEALGRLDAELGGRADAAA